MAGSPVQRGQIGLDGAAAFEPSPGLSSDPHEGNVSLVAKNVCLAAISGHCLIEFLSSRLSKMPKNGSGVTLTQKREKVQETNKVDGFLMAALLLHFFHQSKCRALLRTCRPCPTRHPQCLWAGTNPSLATETLSHTSCTTRTKALATKR